MNGQPLGERLSAVEERMKDVGGLSREVPKVARRLTTVEAELKETREDVAGLGQAHEDLKRAVETSQEARENRKSEERRAIRIAVIGLLGMVLVAIIGGVVSLIVTFGGGTP